MKERAFRPAILGGLAVAMVFLSGSLAIACPFVVADDPSGEAAPTSVASLPEGIAAGWVHCPGEAALPLVVWTLAIDPDAAFIGVRDAPLFRPLPANPLIDVAGVGLDDDAAFSIFARADQAVQARQAPDGPDTRQPFWLFGTLCARAAADRLDCSVRGGRLKARVDVRDSDGDGVLDLDRHEISILTEDRLQVLRFAVPHDAEWLGVVAHWVKAMSIVGFR
ncbi:MAG: hypothetical protein AAF899_12485 [Pseudomonadota bacterium]